MFPHHTVPLKSMKRCHCTWFQTDVCYVLSYFSLFPVCSHCRKHLKDALNRGGLYARLKNYIYFLNFTHFHLSSVCYVLFSLYGFKAHTLVCNHKVQQEFLAACLSVITRLPTSPKIQIILAVPKHIFRCHHHCCFYFNLFRGTF